jgi:A/G-specific adenine glycosylase
VSRSDFDAVWVGPAQLARALDGLVADGLVDPLPDGRYALPGYAARAQTATQAQTA